MTIKEFPKTRGFVNFTQYHISLRERKLFLHTFNNYAKKLYKCNEFIINFSSFRHSDVSNVKNFKGENELRLMRRIPCQFNSRYQTTK